MIVFLLFYVLPVILCRNCNRYLIIRGQDLPDPPYQWFIPLYNWVHLFCQLTEMSFGNTYFIVNHPYKFDEYNWLTFVMWFTNKDFPNQNFVW